MDQSTPSKRRGLPSIGDDTAISSPPAPWDPADGDPTFGADEEDTGSEPARITAQTASIVPADYELVPGARLGEYQIEQKIGQGGMGVVFSAVHPLIGKRAAIKILKKELCADQHTVERFIDEARVVNQIGHPNIVDIFAFGEMPDGRSYFVMEWLKGETLRERVARGPVTIAETCRLVKQLARALQAAHEKSIIHRDLKPDNVFLVEQRDEPPAVKLLDFGIAKLAHTDHRVERTATGAIVGTPQYIAPEQAKGYAIDARADIYALGGIMFELLTGRPPFVADNAMEMVAKHLMEPAVHVSTLNRDVPGELDELVDRMLAKLPDGRPTLERIIDVVDRVRDRASAPNLLGVHGAASLGAPVPTPAPRGSRDDISVAVSAAMPSVRSGPPWALIGGGVVAAGIIAFIIVRLTGGSGGDPTSSDTTAKPAPVATSQPVPPPVQPPNKMESDPISPPPVKPPPVTAPKQPAIATKQPPAPRPSPPAPPPSPPKARFRLSITGAANPEIRIDGQLSTADALLTYGTHAVEVRAKGMVAQKFTIEVGRGGVAKKVALGPKEQPARPTPPATTQPPDDDHELMTPGSLKK